MSLSERENIKERYNLFITAKESGLDIVFTPVQGK